MKTKPKFNSFLSFGRRGLPAAAVAVAAAISLGSIPAAMAAAECENPDSLTFAIIPTEETVAELQLYKPVTDRLAKLTGKKIEFFMPTSYASVVEGMLSGFVDVAVLGPYSYVIASSKDPTIEVFATYAKASRPSPGGRPRLQRRSDLQKGFGPDDHRVSQR